MKKSVILTMLAAMAVSPVFAQKALVKVEYLEITATGLMPT